MLRRAGSSVCISVCEMGRTALIEELLDCQERGVRVRVLLCPLNLTPLLPSGILNVGAVETLLSAGIPVRLYRTGADFIRMHLKLAIFDDEHAIVGSTNWTRSGFQWIGETDIELHDGQVIAQLNAQFETDWRRSDPATPPSNVAKWLHRHYERRTQ